MIPVDPPTTDSHQALALAVRALRELLTLADSFGLMPGWVDEAALELHWQRLTGQKVKRNQRSLIPFGRPLVAVGVASPCNPGTSDSPRLPGYIALNREILERATLSRGRRLDPIYEAIAAVTMGINHARQFTASFTEDFAEEREKQRWPLSQVVVLACGGHFYLDPLEEPFR